MCVAVAGVGATYQRFSMNFNDGREVVY